MDNTEELIDQQDAEGKTIQSRAECSGLNALHVEQIAYCHRTLKMRRQQPYCVNVLLPNGDSRFMTVETKTCQEGFIFSDENSHSIDDPMFAPLVCESICPRHRRIDAP